MAAHIVTRWWWVRHAPVTTDGGRLYGQRDMPADLTDKAAFAALAEGLPRGAVWVTSHLQRATQTAESIFAAGMARSAAAVEPDLAEQGFGEWQGRLRDELFAEDLAWPGYWRPPVEEAPPGGESFRDVFARVSPVVERLSARHGGRDIVAVTHGGTIRAALVQALGLDPESAIRLAVGNLSVTRIHHIAEAPGGQGRVAWQVPGINLPPRALRRRRADP